MDSNDWPQLPDAPADIDSPQLRIASSPVALQPIRHVRSVLEGNDLAQSPMWFEALLRPSDLGEHPDVASYIQQHLADRDEMLIDAAAVEACEDIALGLDKCCRLGINVFATSLECRAFYKQFLLPRLQRMADHVEICLELSKLTEVGDWLALERSLTQLRGAGIRIALDDPGADCCHLHLLGKGLIDVVKLDARCALDIDRCEHSRTRVRHLLADCKETGSTLVLVGVERLHTLSVADALGVPWAQGHALGCPRRYAAPPR